MLIIPGIVISVLTFPGVVIHEWSHKKFCDWFGVPVRSVRYFRLGNPAGYVIHAVPANFIQTFWISIGPLVINSLFAVVFGFLASRTGRESLSWYLLLWLGFSAGMQAFPSDTDMKSNHFLLAWPFIVLVWLANKLKFFWFDFFFAVLLVGLGYGLSVKI